MKKLFSMLLSFSLIMALFSQPSPVDAAVNSYTPSDGETYTVNVGDTLTFNSPFSVSGSASFWAYNWFVDDSGKSYVEESHETNSATCTIKALKAGTVSVLTVLDESIATQEPHSRYNAITKRWETYYTTSYRQNNHECRFNIEILSGSGTAKTYTIAFDGNGSTSGSVEQMDSCKYGTKYTLTANTFKRTGYTFSGWNTAKDGSGKSYKNKASVKDLASKSDNTVTLYAQWSKVKVGAATLNSARSSKAKQITVKYDSVSGAKGYQIVYATDKNFQKNVSKDTTTDTSFTIRDATAGKTYYVRVRAYKKDSAGKKVFGKYSDVKKVKVKK